MSQTAHLPPNETPQVSRLYPWRELASYGWMGMELSWIALWSRMMLRLGLGVSYFRVFMVLSGIWLLIYTLTRWTQRINLKLGLRRLLFLIALLAGLTVAFELLLSNYGQINIGEILSKPIRTFQDMADLVPNEFMLILLVLFVAWRSITMADQQVAPFSIIAGFRFGILMFFFYALLGSWSESAPVIALVLFLFASLLAMSTSRVAVLSQLRGGQLIPFDRRWMAGIIVSISLIVVGALAVALLLGGRGFQALSILFTGVMYFIVLLFSPVIFLALQAIMWVGQLLNLGNILAALLDLIKTMQEFIENILSVVGKWMSGINADAVRQVINWFVISRPWLMWGAILVVIVILLISLRQSILKHEKEVDNQDVETLIGQKDLLDILKDALRRGLGRVMDQIDKFTQLRHARRLFAAARIRRIYAKLLNLSESLGEPRRNSWTPLEFLPRLEGIFPSLEKELELITDAYLRVRYGELPESFEEITQVEQSWGKVRDVGQERLRELKKRKNA